MQLLEQRRGKPFALIGINSDKDDTRDLGARIRQSGRPWRHALDGNTSGPLSSQWNVRYWPTMVLLDQAGVIRWRGHSTAEVEPLLDRLLQPASAGR